METIFVQIASYRDPELIPTVLDCIKKAADPDRIHFGICAQHDPVKDDLEDLLFIHEHLKIKFVHYKDSKGTCWARSQTEMLYANENFSLQIDSHMRFVNDWDIKLIDMWKSLKDGRAILTAYPGKYYPDKPESEWPIEAPTTCNVTDIINGKFKQRGEFINNHTQLERPLRGVALSAAYVFTTGNAVTEVPYDPYLYFDGEEMAMCLRYYTHGFNLYHPNKVFIQHYWTREGYKHHWDDHEDWSELENVSVDRLQQLIKGNKSLGKYGLGEVRTIKDYQNYADIDLELGVVHDRRLKNYEPIKQ